MNTSSHPVIRSGVLLGIIALLGTALLAGVNVLTHDRIIAQEKRRMLQQLNEIIPTTSFNNDLLADVISITDQEFLRHPDPVTVYRARMDGQPVAVLMTVTAPDGYNGDIQILTGIDITGTLLGVRVVSHRETPGLGDPIDIEKSDWVLGFKHKSLRNPEGAGWAVRKDGGQFDQFTGATISPRAVVKTVHDTLLYFAANQELLFTTPTEPKNQDDR